MNGGAFVEMKGICKEFAHVYALDHVDFNVRRGEVHALLGENEREIHFNQNTYGGVSPGRRRDSHRWKYS